MLQRQNIVGFRWIGWFFMVCSAALAGWLVFGGAPYWLDEQGNVKSIVAVVEQFMEAGAQGDVPAAQHVIFGSSRTLTSDTLDALFQTRPDLFDHYQSIKQELYGVGISTGWRGTQAVISGNVSYTSHPNRSFQAHLLKRNNQWRLITISFGEAAAQAPTR